MFSVGLRAGLSTRRPAGWIWPHPSFTIRLAAFRLQWQNGIDAQTAWPTKPRVLTGPSQRKSVSHFLEHIQSYIQGLGDRTIQFVL